MVEVPRGTNTRLAHQLRKLTEWYFNLPIPMVYRSLESPYIHLLSVHPREC